jgi:Lycopene cyclase protein
VTYVPALVTGIDAQPQALTATISTSAKATPQVRARLATLAGGAVSSKFLQFETGAPPVAAQTAYGITARVRNYEAAYDPAAMVFMDYRRTHSGLWDSTALRLQPLSAAKTSSGDLTHHPNWDGELGTTGEAPSFLYAMPLDDGTVFLEETCLVARPTLPFSTLQRRLLRRCEAMGIEVEEVRRSVCMCAGHQAAAGAPASASACRTLSAALPVLACLVVRTSCRGRQPCHGLRPAAVICCADPGRGVLVHPGGRAHASGRAEHHSLRCCRQPGASCHWVQHCTHAPRNGPSGQFH